MRIRYHCERCGRPVGEIDLPESEISRLGFGILSPEERSELIQTDETGDGLLVASICDDCLVAAGFGFSGRELH